MSQDCYKEYRYTDCLLPGYPELHFRLVDYWDRFWRTYAYLSKSRTDP